MPLASSMTSTGGIMVASLRLASGDLVTVLVSLMSSSLLNGDAPMLGLFLALDTDMQHTVAILGLDGARVGVVGEGDHPPETAGEALVDMHGGLLGNRISLALAGDGEDALFELHFDARRVEPRGEGVDLHRAGGTAHVQGREAPGQAPDAGAQVEALLQLPLQTVQFRKDVAGKYRSIRHAVLRFRLKRAPLRRDRKSTRLNSSHHSISYAVFCLKKKK